jgi:hypothetical protein
VNSLGKDQGSTKSSENIIEGKKKNHTFKNQLIVLPSGKDIVNV